MNKKTFLLLILLSLLLISPNAFAQDTESSDDYLGVKSYTIGEQIFSLDLGIIFPLFSISPFAEPTIGTFEELNLGACGSIKWGTFISDNFYLGADLSGMFTSTTNERRFAMIPISFTAGYYFIFWPIEIPVYINTGFSFMTLSDYFMIIPSIRPGFGAYWNINGDWAVGINTEYWFMPEFYFSWDDRHEQSLIANFLQISLSAVYHF